MNGKLSEEQINHMHRNWRGNGGRSSLYNLAKKHELTVNETYVILSTPLNVALKRVATGKKFISYKKRTTDGS